MAVNVEVPYKWTPRHYQMQFWQAMMMGCKRSMLVWHRRAGKDLTAFNWAVFDMIVNNPGGQWWHVWPTYEQGRKGWWDGADNSGRRYLDYIPPEMIASKSETSMKITLKNGSIYRVVGAEDPDRLVGANPKGLIMTEYSLHNPAAWGYLRPILAANDGTAIFPFTPRGRNHAYETYLNVRDHDGWFTSVLSVEDSGALPASIIQEERDAGMSEELIQQEYYCSFDAPMSGAYYASQMRMLMDKNRITSVPYDPALGVETWWDIGVGDETAIWFIQRLRDEWRAIDYMEGSGKGLDEWIASVLNQPYIYKAHIMPHDIEAREMSTAKTRRRFAEDHGLRPLITSPRMSVDEGIDAVRRELPNFWFDEQKCFLGIEALRGYHKEFDQKRQVFREKPAHDWSSHGADAFRTGVQGTRRGAWGNKPRQVKPKYDIFAKSKPYGAR